jgi:hypothetical protein
MSQCLHTAQCELFEQKVFSYVNEIENSLEKPERHFFREISKQFSQFFMEITSLNPNCVVLSLYFEVISAANWLSSFVPFFSLSTYKNHLNSIIEILEQRDRCYYDNICYLECLGEILLLTKDSNGLLKCSDIFQTIQSQCQNVNQKNNALLRWVVLQYRWMTYCSKTNDSEDLQKLQESLRCIVFDSPYSLSNLRLSRFLRELYFTLKMYNILIIEDDNWSQNIWKTNKE